MKKIIVSFCSLLCVILVHAQNIDKVINAKEVERIERILSADDMEGRKPATPGGIKAANFIASEFGKSGLQFFPGLNSYLQSFNVIKTKLISKEGNINGQAVTQDNLYCMTTQPTLNIDEKSGYRIVIMDTGNIINNSKKIKKEEKNSIILVGTALAQDFSKLKYIQRDIFGMSYNLIFVLTNETNPASYNFNFVHEITTVELNNVVGYLPGKSKKDEFVVFAGHYDHLGIGKPNADMDSIFNGANDDAAGTTAVIMLANYFRSINDNERSVVFVAFTSEESGGYGSRYFSQNIDADKTMAMFNIEMIGTESKWGTNSAYITGYEKSDFGKILQSNLTGSNFHFEPDPYPKQNLFYRSDNATLAVLGVPAHTISTSKMDSEKYYHTVDDEIETLDMKNMAEIIKAIAISSRSIISGKDTPTRIEKLK